MPPNGEEGWLLRLRKELRLREHCRQYHLPIWQCPQMLFVVMGGITVTAILGFNFAFSKNLDPYSVALIAIALAVFLLVQAFIIVHAFERIADANRMQVEFINIATHQLRSPVTAARWALDMATTEIEKTLSPEAKTSVHIVRDAISRMGQLVSSILRLVRIEASTDRPRSEIISLRDIISELTQSLKKRARITPFAIRTNFSDDPVYVRADIERIRFVVDHLFDNALLYSSGTPDITVAVMTDGKNARVEVQDRGAGVPVVEQRHVFERFFRASNARTLSPDGVGLSLYIANRFIQDAGGRIGFTSRDGGGSMFWFTIPIVKPHE